MHQNLQQQLYSYATDLTTTKILQLNSYGQWRTNHHHRILFEGRQYYNNHFNKKN